MSASAARVYIQVESEAEQQEHLKQQRKTLKPIQASANANDKENLTGRVSIVDHLSRLKAGVNTTPKYGKRKCVDTAATTTTITTQDADTQTEDCASISDADKPITAADLTSESEPGENYYKLLSEQRRVALEETLNENRHLHERIEGLEEEMKTMRQELDEAKTLVEVLKEICDENDGDDEQTHSEDQHE
ncbi:hypothetical protein AWZ03_002515 [Drosophila navojoa]|uniref:Geminin n=1 Tax=Drosophila navojoa TaxID=7232 RepID=A0A484BSF1_DRONA|nr:uncharacterized protein LOC108654528 [Drosophila navojoa]TDG51152.1 hypothetical protein AWZ03_002515 [Drosophila navojoa]